MAKHVCPWWVGYLLASPLRRLFHNPDTILAPFVKSGMTVLDIGPGMGFFTLPMAAMVGPAGKVVCVDVQERMLRSLEKRARAAHLTERIVIHACGPTTLGLDDFERKFDFVLAFAVVHEVPDPHRFLAEVAMGLKTEGTCLLVEPCGHVTARDFEATLALAAATGLTIVAQPAIPRSRTAALKKTREAGAVA